VVTPISEQVRTHTSGPWPLSSTMPASGALLSAPAMARAYVRTVLAGWKLYDHVIDAAEVVISELVTNVVQEAEKVRGRIPVYQIRLLSDGKRLMAEVWDQLPGEPVVTEADGGDESGRGLFLVQALAADWGWRLRDAAPGKCVWALLG
jgi:anti-sigma regulatory factor (Ser/Thr protein kinase)